MNTPIIFDDSSTIYKIFERYFEIVDTISKYIIRLACFLISCIAALIIAQITLRNTIGGSPTWINELSSYLVIWATFLTIGPLIWEDNHLKIEIAFQKLPQSTQYWCRLAELALLSLFGFILFIWGMRYAFISGTQATSPNLHIEMFWMYLAIPIGGLLFSFFTITSFLRILIGLESVEVNQRGGNIVIEEESDRENIPEGGMG